MSYQVSVLRRAKRELSAAAEWYFERSADKDVSQQWLNGAQDIIDSLADNPQRGSIARESAAFDAIIREISYGSGRRKTHRILFRIIEGENLVEVIGVRHFARRDLAPDEI